MPDMNIIWLIGVAAFLVLEAFTYQMLSIWFVFGAIGGLIAALSGASFTVQMTVFLVTSVALLAFLRPISMKLVKNKDFKTNADSLIGKAVLITQDVDNASGSGQGKIEGMYWTVRSENGEMIVKDSTATVKRIEGVKLIVECIK